MKNKEYTDTIYNVVEIVRAADGRLRVKAYDGSFVRFPRNLRIEGKKYNVKTLRKQGTYWLAIGNIQEVK